MNGAHHHETDPSEHTAGRRPALNFLSYTQIVSLKPGALIFFQAKQVITSNIP